MGSAKAWLTVAVLGLVLVSLVAADDAPAKASWYKRWFGKTAKKVPEPKDEEPTPTISGSQLRAQAEAAYLRRNAVCLKLQTIAFATNDTDLERKVNLLTKRNWEVYCKRIAQLPSGADERLLDEQLRTTAPAVQPSARRSEPIPGPRSASRE